jgi:hypothetical protein
MNNMENEQLIDGLDKKKIAYNKFYIDVNRIDMNSIKFMSSRKNDTTFINAFYNYHDDVYGNLRILCKGLRLRNYINWGKSGEKKKYTIQYDQKDPISIDFKNKLKLIKETYYDHIAKNFPSFKISQECTAQIKNSKYFDLIIPVGMTGDICCRMVKLGSKTENNTNTEIQTIRQIEGYLKKMRYSESKEDNYNFYRANILVGLKMFLSHGSDESYRFNVSFKVVVRAMEIYHNKASCVSQFDNSTKILVEENIMIL